MNEKITEEIENLCRTILTDGVKPLLQATEEYAFFVDPVLNINRNRVNAEIYKSLCRLKKKGLQPFDDDIGHKILKWLTHTQNPDGSWNEIHSQYNQPSALLTSFVGEAFLMANERDNGREIVETAKEYVLSQEFSPGYFKKSDQNYTDCLNVNATCGAFLAAYAEKYDDDKCMEAARRAAHHVCYFQFPTGMFPYTSDIRGYPYKYHHYVPCIHYQGVTLFFLSKIHRVLQENWIQHALEKGGKWLASVQQNNGYFKWSQSGLLYAYYLAGAYAFATSSFLYLSQWKNNLTKNAQLSLTVLEKNVNGIVNRWEQSSLWSLPKGITDAMCSASLGQYPLSHRFYRLGYGAYKQLARRRYSKELNDAFFQKLSTLINIESTWIEPSKNYPDLFNTSEVLDCLTTSLEFLQEEKTYAL